MDDLKTRIAIAGATGDLGGRIARYLIQKGASVTALVRSDSNQDVVSTLKAVGCDIVFADYNDMLTLKKGVAGARCVVSALSGVRDVIVTAQHRLLNACVDAGVPRFIPSDYCIDYRSLKPGQNRNLDFRREFSRILSGNPIKATSVLNGMFTDLLAGQAPVILQKQKRIFFWGDADQRMDFTTIDNTAEYVAEVALDEHSPRWLMIAGEVASMRDIKTIASKVFNKEFKFFRPGGLSAFQKVINVTRFFAPGKNETFPAWQGMQYLHDMLSGVPKLVSLNNDRYPRIEWTSIGDFLKRNSDQ